MRLISSIFRSKNKEEDKFTETPKGFQGGEICRETPRGFQEAETDACTSCSCRGSEEQGDNLEHEILSGIWQNTSADPGLSKRP